MSTNRPSVTFGLLLSTTHAPGDDLGQRLREHRAQVVAAREAGMTSIAVGQHFLTGPIQTPAALPLAGSLVDLLGDMRLVLGVILLPLLNPVLLGEDIATLDWLSGGKLIFGVGLGYRGEEFAAAGVAREERVGRMLEGLRLLRTMWTGENMWTFSGKYFEVPPTPAGLQPCQAPHPPIWMAADVDAAVRRAARVGATWYINPRARREGLTRQVDIYRSALTEQGLDMPAVFPIRREAFIAKTDGEARRMAARHLRRMLKIYEAWGQYEAMPDADSADRDIDEDHIPDMYLVGTPARVAELVARHVEDLGVNHFVLRMQWPGMTQVDVLRSIDMLGDRLMPALAHR